MISVCAAPFSMLFYFDLHERYFGEETIKDNKAENCCFVDCNLHLKKETLCTYAYPKSRLFMNNALLCTRMRVSCSVLGMISIRNSSSETPDHSLLLERG